MALDLPGDSGGPCRLRTPLMFAAALMKAERSGGAHTRDDSTLKIADGTCGW